MGIVNAKLLSDNLKRIEDLQETGLSDETIASAVRDKTGDATITAEDVAGFSKLGRISTREMLVSAKQAGKLTAFARAADDAAVAIVQDAKQKSMAGQQTEAAQTETPER